ncbi:aldose 1-epimerase family protein [Methylocapsa palsarum]|uniref:Galactose mutarotase n=1 Tax=Methylocapsa palsarum TaxID=1612308 RepID=A0A1I4A0S1_9HYPH|nr:aldose 1-epimerase family protein [Methylocapsa palsarum]SFK49945.1 Galactose mutarotase [Methylocapsa palsarum]
MDHVISHGGLAALVRAQGAELRSLRDREGTEYIWQAGPEWARSAPTLFPIVGRLKDDLLHHGGQSYRLTQHGFARDRLFSWLERSAESCRLSLCDDAGTRAVYPFAFRLELAYAIRDGALTMTLTVVNTGIEPLPASFGAHPAFNWPLRPGVPPEDYTLTFAQEEPAPIRRLSAGLLRPEPFPSPVEGRVLTLREDLFEADAIIMDQVASRSVRFSAPAGPGLDIAWDGFRELGLWTKTGARFLCIEPWLGMASPVDFDGPFVEKPGVALIPPGESLSASMRIKVIPGVD